MTIEPRANTLADYYRDAGVFVPAFADTIYIKRTRKPLPHQVSGLRYMTQHTRFLLLDDPGTGKTLIAQAYALWLVGQQNRGVCVMPPALLDQFLGSLEDTFPGYEDHVKAEILIGTPAQRDKQLATWDVRGMPDLVLLSPQMFVRYYQTFLKKGFNFGIFDEATIIGLKSSSNQMYKAVKTFAGNHRKDSNGIVLMTGTPVETHVPDAYGLISLVNPDQYGSLRTFEKVHCRFAPTYYHSKDGAERQQLKIIGYQKLDVLHRNLLVHGRRVKKADVNKDLPPRIITEMPIKLSPKHRALYLKLTEERILEVGDRVLDFTESSALYQGMQRALLTPERYADHPVDNALMETIETLVESLAGRKVIVYAWYKDSIQALRARFAHLNPAVMNSTMSSRRTAEKLKFIMDPTCLMVIANPRSGGVGIDGWQAVCSHIIFAEVCPFVGTFQQSISRLHRTGQTSDVINVWVLVATGTIAVKLRNDLIKADKEQEDVIQDKRRVLFDLRGEQGLVGSLDDIDFEKQMEGENSLIDNDQD